MSFRPLRRMVVKIEQISLLATLVLAFAALAALVLSGQAGIREDLRALRIDMVAGQTELREDLRATEAGLREELGATEAGLREDLRATEARLRAEMRAGYAELRAGQVQLREDLAGLGVRLAVVEHRTDKLESRFAAMEPGSTGPCEALDCPES